MIRSLAPVLVAALLLAAGPARAHHGVAAATFAAAEGPGAALETTSALPLPRRTLFLLAKAEAVPFRRFASREPENKAFASYNVLAAGYGVTPWLSAYVFQPVSAKDQDGVGRNVGLGDTNLLLALALKWDEGLRLVPEKESLDELADWHFSLWASTTLPAGSTSARDDAGAYFAPDMMIGFGKPSPAAGVAALKQLSTDVTLLLEASYQHFFPHTYDFTRYQFGGETRANAALVWRAWARGGTRLDLSGELNGLHLRRDRERNEAGVLEALEGGGGAILYAGAGLRLQRGALSAALGVRRAALKDLNEASTQQGSEGLERFRASLALSWSTGL